MNSISFYFNFDHFKCNSHELTNDGATLLLDVTSSITSDTLSCPHCGSRVHVYDNDTVTLKDMPYYPELETKLKISLKRFRCTSCNASFTEEIPFKYPGTRVTKKAAMFIKSLLKHHMSIKDISCITGIHWGTISKIHKEFMSDSLKKYEKELEAEDYKPKYLAVDEFAIHKGHSYATCVLDLERGHVIWVGRGRAKKDFANFFKDVPSDYLSEVQAVAMDMNASYYLLVEANMPHAEIVYDRYHMQAQYGKEVLGAVRLKEAAKHKESAAKLKKAINTDMSAEEVENLRNAAKSEQKQYRTIKRSRWTLLKNSDNLSSKRAEQLESILQSHEQLAICYAMKEEMCRLFQLTDSDEARKGWSNWFDAAEESGIQELVHFAELKRKRLPGLISHAKHNISTGKLEGFNNRIKVAKRIGFGYRNDDHFFTMIKYLSIPESKGLSPRNS